MKKIIALCAVWAGVTGSLGIKNADAASFNSATGLITLEAVQVGTTEYHGVQIRIGQVLRYTTLPATATVDAFDPATGQLTIRSITVGGVRYTNVVVTVQSVYAVASASPAGTVAPLMPNDALFPDQWHLHNTGQRGYTGVAGSVGEDLNLPRAWNLATGKGIQIAVLDDGLDIYHEDLRIVAGKSWDYRINAYGDPSSGTGSHGTACAGLAAAVGNNGKGMVGVAFDAQLVGYNLLQVGTSYTQANALVKDMGSNHIYTNSYGATDALGTFQPAETVWENAITTGLNQGRDGKGAIYVWAAGNGAPRDRSDYDEQANFYGVIAVTSLNDQGKASVYAEAGANVLISAYGGEYCDTHTLSTTDVTAGAGFNNGITNPEDYLGKPHYTRCMNGTSGAAPQIAGVVALMLEANPALTWRDVRMILTQTARQNDPTHPDWKTNAGGLLFNPQYGYGAADAFAAVTAAKTWVNVAPQKIATGQTSPNNPIALNHTGIRALEFVELTITSKHTHVGDLRITLNSPSGTISTLAIPHTCTTDTGVVVGCGSGLITGFRFGIAQLIGESAEGLWTLSVHDTQKNSPAELLGWSIRAMGF
ncbi:MAG: hypothetical protein RIR79_819 [Pseudomonadota bacterium]